jgi:hypothetical protein
VPLKAVWPPRLGVVSMTMSRGQWDTLLEVGYDLGFVLIELNHWERPVVAYCKDKFHPADN